ncbi:MAG: hypothetical protein KAT15_23250, partial [Bacteroidales bacterium]|nr:hypothetical protein [Bacteroidales bacterium]
RMGFRKKDLYHRLLADQYMIRELAKVEEDQPEKMSILTELGNEFREGVDKFRMRAWVFSRPGYSLPVLILAGLCMLLLLPVFLYGAVTNYFPYWLPVRAVRKIKDIQFHSTVKFVLGTILFPIYYFILFIPVWVLTEPSWIKWAFLGSLPLSGLFAYTWMIWFKKLRSLSKYQFLTLTRKKKLARLKELRKQIVDLTESLIPDPVSEET